MRQAIKECIEQNILKDFLETNAAEVMNMLLTEWNWYDAFIIQREEGREESRESIARNLLKKGWSPEETTKTTEMDLEKVRSLAASLLSGKNQVQVSGQAFGHPCGLGISPPEMIAISAGSRKQLTLT
jgi:predicted transposase YdaD